MRIFLLNRWRRIIPTDGQAIRGASLDSMKTTLIKPRIAAFDLLLAALGTWLFFAIPTARAELPSIRFDRIAPLGAGAGTAVEVEVAGRDIEDVNSLLFDRPGLAAELVK